MLIHGNAAVGPAQLQALRAHQAPITGQSIWQIVSTFSLYFACTALMYLSLRVSIWLTMALAVPASLLVVRIFMFQHDCGHGSMFRAPRASAAVGMVCSLITLTPFAYWRRLHARHHGSWNNLDHRGIPADFFSDCATLAEYIAMTRRQKRLYRLTHHPLLVHFILPPIVFILLYRLPFDTPASFRLERLSVYTLNIALILCFGALVWAFGAHAVLLVHLPALILAAIIGIWLFSVQHRFEAAQWAHSADWNFTEASLAGTSHLKLPRILQWFSGNIGLHHIHHLRPGIPNYRLESCHNACLPVSAAATLSFSQALKAPSYALWDEQLRRMVPFPSRRLAKAA